MPDSQSPRIGLVLSGGGARGAYQAGVLRGVSEIHHSLGLRKTAPIITGVSAGAINATFLAAHADDFLAATRGMANLWGGLTADQVFCTGAFSAGRSGLRLAADAALGALYHRKLARSFLDTAPLANLLEKSIPFENIQKNIDHGYFSSLAISATNYNSAKSVTFVQARPGTPSWSRSRRFSQEAVIRSHHVMASAAIPIFFPPIQIGTETFGDGCLRNMTPLSPAIHLGAERLLVISVRRPDDALLVKKTTGDATLAKVLGVIINAILLDGIEVDMERLLRINHTVNFVPAEQREQTGLRGVEVLWIRPSRDIGQLAESFFNRLPRMIRYFVSGFGSPQEASELTSYLLFHPEFCGALAEMGYEDALARQDSIAAFLSGQP